MATVNGIAVRRRKLPADVVVWTVIGAAIFSRWSFDEVVRAFGLTPPTHRGTARSAPRSSSVAEARHRLGSEVIRHVFGLATASWLDLREMMGPEWQGLRVLAADGSAFCTPDTPSNREAFKLPASDKDKPQAAYPQVKVLALLDVHSHVVLDAEVGDCRTGDITLFEAMISRVPDHSLVILDRGFRSWGMLHRLGRSGTQRHWLLRTHRTLKARLVTTLGPGDRIVEIETSSKARELDPLLPKRMRVREITYAIGQNVYKLITSLLDPILFRAEELVRLYHARWEIEIAFDDIKTEQRGGNDVLRSRKPDGIHQEIWGYSSPTTSFELKCRVPRFSPACRQPASASMGRCAWWDNTCRPSRPALRLPSSPSTSGFSEKRSAFSSCSRDEPGAHFPERSNA